MKNTTRKYSTRYPIVAFVALILMFQAAAQSAAPKISITDVPHAGKGGDSAMERIAGKVAHLNSKDSRIVLYALAGGKWWVQPYADSPYTDIDANGNWHSQTHLGSDYAALLVSPNFQAPATVPDLRKLTGVITVTKIEGKR
ncbi:MAG TPA: hypothetical protein VFP71_04525 [Candidatus Angelobacter sp.]|nr:hypothetical protein [Candidatus Angelobacter sp.]